MKCLLETIFFLYKKFKSVLKFAYTVTAEGKPLTFGPVFLYNRVILIDKKR